MKRWKYWKSKYHDNLDLVDFVFDIMDRIEFYKKEANHWSCAIEPYVEKRMIELEEGE